jgi:hypothetical protein
MQANLLGNAPTLLTRNPGFSGVSCVLAKPSRRKDASLGRVAESLLQAEISRAAGS